MSKAAPDLPWSLPPTATLIVLIRAEAALPSISGRTPLIASKPPLRPPRGDR